MLAAHLSDPVSVHLIGRREPRDGPAGHGLDDDRVDEVLGNGSSSSLRTATIALAGWSSFMLFFRLGQS